MAKSPRLRRYRVAWTTVACGFQRALTLRAANKAQAKKLVADSYPAKKHHITCLK